MAGSNHRWVIACTCGWDKEASSAWDATEIASRHARHLSEQGAEHVITIKEPSDTPRERPE
ncbi:MAG TPA: hypothetical protein VJX92_05555 [Methylomirabilota bacterium]|nr:hypothetical protein [Methylomirabilota bacterium]